MMECTEEAESVLAWPARSGWKSNQDSGRGKESANLDILNHKVRKGGPQVQEDSHSSPGSM